MIRPTVATVSLDAIQSNLRAIHDLLAREARTPEPQGTSRTPREPQGAPRNPQEPPATPRIIAVVKANAYGHGAARVGPALEAAGASMLACADIEEGVLLRDAR